MTPSCTELLPRRRLLTGALSFAVLPALASSRARAANAFDGSWGGLDAHGETVQIIFVDGQIIGFYWRGDYVDASAAKFDGAGSSLSFSFRGGQAVVKVTSDAVVTLVTATPADGYAVQKVQDSPDNMAVYFNETAHSFIIHVTWYNDKPFAQVSEVGQ